MSAKNLYLLMGTIGIGLLTGGALESKAQTIEKPSAQEKIITMEEIYETYRPKPTINATGDTLKEKIKIKDKYGKRDTLIVKVDDFKTTKLASTKAEGKDYALNLICSNYGTAIYQFNGVSIAYDNEGNIIPENEGIDTIKVKELYPVLLDITSANITGNKEKKESAFLEFLKRTGFKK